MIYLIGQNQGYEWFVVLCLCFYGYVFIKYTRELMLLDLCKA